MCSIEWYNSKPSNNPSAFSSCELNNHKYKMNYDKQFTTGNLLDELNSHLLKKVEFLLRCAHVCDVFTSFSSHVFL